MSESEVEQKQAELDTNVYRGWLELTEENGFHSFKWKPSGWVAADAYAAALRERDQARRELEELRERRCETCAHGWWHEETPEFGVGIIECTMFKFTTPRDDFYCAAWERRAATEAKDADA